MIPGEIIPAVGTLTWNANRATITLMVAKATGDRPVQVGSHYHFAEANPGLDFDRAGGARHAPRHPAGTAIRFEPGQRREVRLVTYEGAREVWGFNGQIMGALDAN